MAVGKGTNSEWMLSMLGIMEYSVGSSWIDAEHLWNFKNGIFKDSLDGQEGNRHKVKSIKYFQSAFKVAASKISMNV